jgi:N6-L-threonylcarbamoyladenine synthase
MKILAIETSCDETAIAILECEGGENPPAGGASFKVLGNALLSQVEKHREFGGVVPMLAKREHLKNLPHIFDEALAQAKVSMHDVDAIAVTAGPGLEPALWTGIEFAKHLATTHSKPLVAVNHMEGHVLAALAQKTGDSLQITEVKLPVLALLISGGHTELVLMKNWLEYELIGQTLDDAVGEAFDKVARMLGLPYPGGPEISKLAEARREMNPVPSEDGLPQEGVGFRLPRPMIDSKTCDFSFAGLKTAVLYMLKAIPDLTDEKKRQIAHEFENAVGDVLWKKTTMALEQTGAKMLIIGGGVSANTHIRRVFTKKIAEYQNVSLRIPTPDLTTDNAIMIALAGFFRASRGEYIAQPLDTLRASGNLSLA